MRKIIWVHLLTNKLVETMMQALERIKKEKGQILIGGDKLNRQGF